jgi:Arc/MetJ-type ribon-helix-helix transcriptional regulator
MDEQPRTVEIPPQTAAAISERLAGTEFDSVDEYVAFALDQLLYELTRQDEAGEPSDVRDADGDPTADASISDRLESLGYL